MGYEFMPGDRVVLKVDHPDDNRVLVAGCEGTVMVTDGGSIGVDWDDDVHGHDCNGTLDEGRHGHGWYVYDDDIEFACSDDSWEDDTEDQDILGFLGK